MLAIGHVGWHREQDSQSDLVSFSLLFGSLLVGVPLDDRRADSPLPARPDILDAERVGDARWRAFCC